MINEAGISEFEGIKHVNPKSGIEYWFARELQSVLEYTEWRNFISVIEKAKEACKGSDIAVSEHFVGVNKTIPLPKGIKNVESEQKKALKKKGVK